MNRMSSVASNIVADAPAELQQMPRRRLAMMLAVPLLILVAGLYFWLTSGATVSTDNAAVKQDIVSVSAQVNGPVIALLLPIHLGVAAGVWLASRPGPAPGRRPLPGTRGTR